MAKLYVTEFSDEGQSVRGAMAVVATGTYTEQTPVVVGGGSLQSAAFGAATVVVRIHTDLACSIAFGTNPSATVNTMRMAADQVEYFGVPVGLSYKVAVIAN